MGPPIRTQGPSEHHGDVVGTDGVVLAAMVAAGADLRSVFERRDSGT